MNGTEKLILTGLYLSKFDTMGLHILGFETFTEAFNILGYSLGGKPNSIKNYRDEFDPFFNNSRKGWHKRAMRDNCSNIYKQYMGLSFFDFTELIKTILVNNYSIEKITQPFTDLNHSSTIAKRLLTGKAAEEYFTKNYNSIFKFQEFNLENTTNLGCGFDFKLTFEDQFYCVEVKGLNELKGNIQLTEKEFKVASMVKENYCLFIVKNFREQPVHDVIFNPLESTLKFKQIERQIIQKSYISLI